MKKKVDFTKEQTTAIMEVFINEWNAFIKDYKQGCPFNKEERLRATRYALEALSKIPYDLFLVGDYWVDYIMPKVKDLEPLSLDKFIIRD